MKTPYYKIYKKYIIQSLNVITVNVFTGLLSSDLISFTLPVGYIMSKITSPKVIALSGLQIKNKF